MQKILTAEEMREVDRLTTEKYGIPSILLMENAAHAAARVITKKLGGSVSRRYFLILCGKGNNGGDGAVLARILWTQGATVRVYLFGFEVDETKGDARINFEALKKIAESEEANLPDSNQLYLYENTESDYFDPSSITEDCVVDALFGTGLTRPLEGEVKKIISSLLKCREELTLSTLVSIDLPSGLNADFGDPIGEIFQADLTVTFTAPKPANILAPASSFNGELVVVNIGSPQELIDNSPSKLFLAEKKEARYWLEKTKFTSASYKNKRGHALVVGGAKNYAGAAILAGNAAIVSGIGLATVAAPESVHNAIASRMLPEVMTRSVAETPNGAIAYEAVDEILEFIEGKIDAVAVGSGMSSSEESTRKFVREFVEKRKTPVVIDADGLNSLAPFDLQGSDELPLILTPHEGEFLKLLGTKDKEAIKDRVKAARDFAGKYNVILVLKGERSLIAAPDGTVVVNPTGNSGLGKAGNGDTLAGIIVGFVAQAAQMKVNIFETIVAAVYIAGIAGDIAAGKFGKRSMLATDVRECLRDAFREIENNE
ncbi:MAG: NAD(P)H-hydrate dehydratase [Pyrinomonadaceae bacterium]|nr:NAD(P)H-hydrate dehydratase [Pyrinomonadaceae bacterium]